MEAIVHNLVEINSLVSRFLIDNGWSVQMVMVASNDERARCSCSVLGRNKVLGKIEVLGARFFKMLEHLARTEH